MFVRITGFGTSSGVELPVYLRNPISNSKSVVFAVIRWMSPHLNANLCDSELTLSPFDKRPFVMKIHNCPRPVNAYQLMDRKNVEDQLSIF